MHNQKNWPTKEEKAKKRKVILLAVRLDSNQNGVTEVTADCGNVNRHTVQWTTQMQPEEFKNGKFIY
jgi:hypothetical protein